jgi:hypothetical protein
MKEMRLVIEGDVGKYILSEELEMRDFFHLSQFFNKNKMQNIIGVKCVKEIKNALISKFSISHLPYLTNPYYERNKYNNDLSSKFIFYKNFKYQNSYWDRNENNVKNGLVNFIIKNGSYDNEFTIDNIYEIEKHRLTNFLDILKEIGGLITGSLVLQCLLKEKWVSDIDIFVSISNYHKLDNFLSQYYHRSSINLVNCKYKNMDERIVYIINYIGTEEVKFQLICVDINPHNLKDFIIETFDYDFCKNIFDGTTLYIHDLNKVMNKTDNYSISSTLQRSVKRYNKYKERGFNIPKLNYEEVQNIAQKFKINLTRDYMFDEYCNICFSDCKNPNCFFSLHIEGKHCHLFRKESKTVILKTNKNIIEKISLTICMFVEKVFNLQLGNISKIKLMIIIREFITKKRKMDFSYLFQNVIKNINGENYSLYDTIEILVKKYIHEHCSCKHL